MFSRKKTIIENEEDQEIVRFSSTRKKVSINIFDYYEQETHFTHIFLYDDVIFLIFAENFEIEQQKKRKATAAGKIF